MENLTSAIPLGNLSNNLSAQEFQKMLSSWFEEKGVLSDLRSQLRFKMVNVLKNTVIGRDIGKRTVQRISLSKQAVNLLVAEYLMQNRCHYSLSIFNTEASLTNILPEYPVIFDNVPTKENEKYHFDKENILNIMELIGIAKTSLYCEELLSLYFSDQENNSILSCLFSLLCKLIYKYDRRSSNEELQTELIDLQKEDVFIKEVGNILIHSDLPTRNLKITLDDIKSFYELEKQNLEKEHARLTSELKTKIGNQELQIKAIQKANKVLENHFVKINKEYRKLKLHMKNLLTQEKLLRESQLKQNTTIKDFSKTVNNNLKENKLVSNSETIFKNQNMICQLQHCTEICKENIRRIEEFRKENKILKEQSNEQKETIKKLSIKCKEVINDFTDCQSKINLLNSKINEGGTKELFDSFLYDENLVLPEVRLRKHVDASDVSSDSVTEEILLQARLRLQRLEEETKEIEDKFRTFRQGVHSLDFK